MKSLKRINASFVLITFFLLTLVGISYAQTDYPIKPVRVIIPYPAGGISDITARVFSEHATKYFPKPLVITNRPGAAGIVAITEVVNSRPDASNMLNLQSRNWRISSGLQGRGFSMVQQKGHSRLHPDISSLNSPDRGFIALMQVNPTGHLSLHSCSKQGSLE